MDEKYFGKLINYLKTEREGIRCEIDLWPGEDKLTLGYDPSGVQFRPKHRLIERLL